MSTILPVQSGQASGLSPLSHLAVKINAEHKAFAAAAQTALDHAHEAGRLLLEVRRQVAHGRWSTWLAENFEGSARTARLYMLVARQWERIAAERQRVADLSFRKALRIATTQGCDTAKSAGLIGPRPQTDQDNQRSPLAKYGEFFEVRFDSDGNQYMVELSESEQEALRLAAEQRERALAPIFFPPASEAFLQTRIAEMRSRFARDVRELDGAEPDNVKALPDLAELAAGTQFMCVGICGGLVVMTPSFASPGYTYLSKFSPHFTTCDYLKRGLLIRADVLKGILAKWGVDPAVPWWPTSFPIDQPWDLAYPDEKKAAFERAAREAATLENIPPGGPSDAATACGEGSER